MHAVGFPQDEIRIIRLFFAVYNCTEYFVEGDVAA